MNLRGKEHACLLSFQEAKKLLIQVVAEMKKGVCNTCLQIIKRLKIVFYTEMMCGAKS
jgi:hypothetical protein